MIDRPNLDFSFSGLKTFARNTFLDNSDKKADIAKAFELAAVDILKIKCQKALEKTGRKSLVISGGVSANLSLREELDKMGEYSGVKIFYPKHEFCTDNGAMIALAASLRFESGFMENSREIHIKPRWNIEELDPLIIAN